MNVQYKPMDEKNEYWLDYAAEDYGEEYLPVLRGPDGFECILGEPEDCTWYRDGRGAVQELNRLANELEAMTFERDGLKNAIVSRQNKVNDLMAEHVADLDVDSLGYSPWMEKYRR